MKKDTSAFSPRRRSMAGSVAAALAVSSIVSTASASGESGGALPPPAPLKDPRELYRKPPFPKQSQPWPGLAAKMDPKPDHGEESYGGRGRLTGRKALITGGASGIGRAAAIAY